MTKLEFIEECKMYVFSRSVTADGYERIRKTIQSDLSKKEKIAALKKEYGWGGRYGHRKKKKCLIGYSYSPKGIEIEILNEDGEKEIYNFNYTQIYDVLDKLYNGVK